MNIEKTISEQAVSDILTPMLESQDRIVTEDVAPLFDQATGLDTPPASGTVTTTIEESRNLISAIIRKAWTATLTMLCGASVIGYITAAYTYLRNRLKGNETYGIPDRRSEISASSPLAANLALLNDRKIGGVPEAADGMSMARILCDSAVAATITEITDDTTGWTMTRQFPWSAFPNANKAIFNMKEALVPIANTAIGTNADLEDLQVNDLETANNVIAYGIKGKDVMVFPKLRYSDAVGNGNNYAVFSIKECRVLIFPALEGYTRVGNNSWLKDMPKLEEVYFFVLSKLCEQQYGLWGNHIGNCENLRKVVYGVATQTGMNTGYASLITGNCPKVIHIEFGEGTRCNIGLLGWNPSYILSDNPTGTDLIEEGSTAQNNLQQFLENFRDYIANRLTDNGSGKTLTLSQAVFSEIWDSQGQPQVKGDGLDELRADIHRIIRTDKQWAVNKA